jgi:hypothetical protein
MPGTAAGGAEETEARVADTSQGGVTRLTRQSGRRRVRRQGLPDAPSRPPTEQPARCMRRRARALGEMRAPLPSPRGALRRVVPHGSRRLDLDLSSFRLCLAVFGHVDLQHTLLELGDDLVRLDVRRQRERALE